MTTLRSHEATPAWENWLAQHDKDVQERGLCFNNYYFFDLTRYPGLRPAPPDDPYARRMFEASQQSVSFRITEQRSLLPPRTTAGLTAGQKNQLAALVFDFVGDTEYVATYEAEAAQWREVGRKGAQQQTRLTKQVQKAQRELEKLNELAGKVPQVLGNRYRVASEWCLKELNDRCAPIPEESLREQLSIHQPEDDLTSFCVVPLYWFFKHECDLSSNESQIRAAMIRNACLTRPGQPPLTYHEGYGESHGCPAVRNALHAYRPSETAANLAPDNPS